MKAEFFTDAKPLTVSKENFGLERGPLAHVLVNAMLVSDTAKGGSLQYQVGYQLVYKPDSPGKKLPALITTPDMSSFCRLFLERGKHYLLGGMLDQNGGARVDLCSLAIPWKNVTGKQHRELLSYRCD
ncbi:hypothetical protein Y032_0009g574 [Ancylostoma ceylanicum]|nr:hypothetical protein Y032_0009g574 [Ancylostoma ceylanicum]